jgi:hypothetical protein
MTKNRWIAAVALAAGLAWTGVARAGEEAPAAPAAPTAASAPKVDTTPVVDTKTPSPMCSVMKWVGMQVAPNVQCGSAEAETAWRAWFSGGAEVPLASLRDSMVADGWTADRTFAFFKKASSGACSKGDCAKGDCSKGDCAKGECCKGKATAGTDAPATAEKASGSASDGGCCKGETAGRADGKPCCGGCKKGEKKEPVEVPAKP